ncbi:unnamed protein product [Symbiodinium sp. CCMP2456]|nr:unnamed protein product [Symbiodinium sp. CCMP2456]
MVRTPCLLGSIFVAKPVQGGQDVQEQKAEPLASSEEQEGSVSLETPEHESPQTEWQDLASCLKKLQSHVEALADEPAPPGKSAQVFGGFFHDRRKPEKRGSLQLGGVSVTYPLLGCLLAKEVPPAESESEAKTLGASAKGPEALRSQAEELLAEADGAREEARVCEVRLGDLEAEEARRCAEVSDLEAMEPRLEEARKTLHALREAADQNDAECEALVQRQAVAKRLEQMRAGLRADKAQQRLTRAALSEAKEEEEEVARHEALLRRTATKAKAEVNQLKERLQQLRDRDVSRQRYWETVPSIEVDKLQLKRLELVAYRDQARALKRLLSEQEARDLARQKAASELVESLALTLRRESIGSIAPMAVSPASAKEALVEHVVEMRRLQARKCELEARFDRERRLRAALERRLQAPVAEVPAEAKVFSSRGQCRSRTSPARCIERRLQQAMPLQAPEEIIQEPVTAVSCRPLPSAGPVSPWSEDLRRLVRAISP